MSDDTDPERRERGLAWMRQVYGWDLPKVEGAFAEMTVDHLFGELWARPGLSVRERRLLLIGLLAGLGEHDVIGLQARSALDLGELTADELRDVVLFVAHYAGWPRGAKLNSLVEEVVAEQARRPET